MDTTIVKEEYVKIGRKTTACCLTLLNGFEITGISACVDPADYDEEIGKEWAKKAALDKYEDYIGFARQQAMHCGRQLKIEG
jgi:hypothetical protein